MKLTIFDAVPQSGLAWLSIDSRSLYCALEQVKDGRKARGKRYPLDLIFTLLLLGKLAGETTVQGVLEWVNLRASLLKKHLDWPRRDQGNATVTRALASCDAEQLVQVVAAVLLKARAEEEGSKPGATTRLRTGGDGWENVAGDTRTSSGASANGKKDYGRVDQERAFAWKESKGWAQPVEGAVLTSRSAREANVVKNSEHRVRAPWHTRTL